MLRWGNSGWDFLHNVWLNITRQLCKTICVELQKSYTTNRVVHSDRMPNSRTDNESSRYLGVKNAYTLLSPHHISMCTKTMCTKTMCTSSRSAFFALLSSHFQVKPTHIGFTWKCDESKLEAKYLTFKKAKHFHVKPAHTVCMVFIQQQTSYRGVHASAPCLCTNESTRADLFSKSAHET